MSNDITYMDFWHFIAPLIPVSTDYMECVAFSLTGLKKVKKVICRW